MTMTSEELRVKVKLDTSGVEQGAAKVKQSLKGIEGAASGVSGATGEASSSIDTLTGALTALTGLRIAEALHIDSEAIVQFTDNIRLSLKSAWYSAKEFKEQIKLNFSKSFYDENIGDNEFTLSNVLKDLKSNIKDLGGEVKTFGRNLKTSFEGGWKAVEGLRKRLLAISIVMVPLSGIMSSFSASALGKEIYNTAQRVGMSTAKYQEWNFILQQTGADITDLIGAQQTLTEAQLDVAEGSEDIINAFKRIGLSSEEVLAMDRQELFERTIAGLQNIENSTERAAVAYRLLSEDGSTLAALLGMSNEETRELANNYQQLGAIMSEELLSKSLRFQGALSNLRAAFQGITNTLAEIFLPVITTIVNALTKAIAMVNMFLRTLFGLELTTSESGTNSSVGAGIGSFGAMTDSIEEADSAAKELRRTLMGFDELNVVDSGSSSSSGGSSSGIGDLGGSIGGGGLNNVGGGLFDPENLNLDGWRETMTKWEGLIQTVVPIAMIGFGAIGAVWFMLRGNWLAALACLTLAGIGFAAADSAGTWQKLQDTFAKLNLEIIPIAMVGIGAVGAIFFALRGNWVGAVAMAAMAGIGLMTLSGGDGFNLEEIKTIKEELAKYAIPIISLAGAIVMGLRGNLVAAAALLAVAGISGVLTHVGEGSLWDGMLKVFDSIMPTLKKYAIPLIAVAGAIAMGLMGNIPVALSLLGVAGITGALTYGSGGDIWDKLTKPIKETWNNIKSWFNANVKPKLTKEYWSNLFNNMKQGIATKIGEARTAIVNGWNNIKTYFLTNIAPKFTLTYWLNKFDSIKQGVSTKIGEARTTIMNGWNNIKGYFTANIAPKFTKAYWINKFDPLRAALSEKLNAARTTVMNAWNNIKTYFTTNIAPKFTKAYWAGKFEPIRAALSEKINAARTVVVNGWNNIKKYFTTNIAPKFTAKFWATKFNTIKDGAKSAFNGLISIVETAINNIIRKLNTVSFSIPSWVPSVGGRSFGIKLSQVRIPRLATGGIVTQSTIANIGENGREAVLPLDNNTQWMDALADKLAARMNPATKVVLKVDERELGYATINAINQNTKQTGGLKLQLV